MKQKSDAEIARIAAENEAEIERMKAQRLAGEERERKQKDSALKDAELKAERISRELEMLRDEKKAEAVRLQKIAAEKEAEIERLNAQIRAAEVAKEKSRDNADEHSAEADEKDEAKDEVSWCQCVGALYDEQTLKCTQCGNDWYIRSETSIPISQGVGDIAQRLSDIESRASALYKMRLRAIMLGVQCYSDFERLNEREQALVMNMCCLLGDMRSASDEYWQCYAIQNSWAQRLLDSRDRIMVRLGL